MSDADYDRAHAHERRIATLEARIAELTRQHEADLSRASEITRGALADLDAARSRIAELERERNDQGEVIRQQETECMRRVARNATLASDYREAEARVAELAREMGAMAAALKEAVATNEELRAERDIAARGRDIAKGDRDRANEAAIRDRADRDRALAHTAELERERNEARHAQDRLGVGLGTACEDMVAIDDHLTAARAERDEAVGLLREVATQDGDCVVCGWSVRVCDDPEPSGLARPPQTCKGRDARAFLARLSAPAPDKEPAP